MIEKLPVLAASAAVILLMLGVAFALGFRPKATLDHVTMAQFAANEGVSVEGAVFAPDAKSAFARLSGGKIMVARAMGGDISARIAPASAVRTQLKGDKLSVRFADVGYPPLHMRVQTPPAWLADLVGEGR